MEGIEKEATRSVSDLPGDGRGRRGRVEGGSLRSDSRRQGKTMCSACPWGPRRIGLDSVRGEGGAERDVWLRQVMYADASDVR